MNASRFDRLTRSFATASSRRLLLRGLATLGLAGGFVQDVARAKKRNKKLKLNEFGCVNVGGKCRGKDSVCCSGICQGKKPKKGKKDKSRCLAHDVGTCQAGQREQFCDGTINDPCTTDTGTSGVCDTTTGNAGYCRVTLSCLHCTKDVDCQTISGNSRAACLRCDGCPAGAGCAFA